MEFCEKVNKKVPKIFCQLVCRGNWQKYCREDIEVLRKRHRKPIGNQDGAVTVVIPCLKENPEHIKMTVLRTKYMKL